MDTIVGLSVGLVLVGLAVVADLNNMLDNNEASSGGSTCTGGADPTFPPYFTSTTEMAESRGHIIHRHVAETEDGVMLTLHRLGDGKGSPVLLMHGLLSASDQWLLRERDHDLASILVDTGYDVWLGNARGNVYSRAHRFMSPDDAQFWNFSWHESGYYDLPAMIEYISSRTGHRKIYFVGYSLGGTFFFVMASTRPEYNQRIRVAILLAPLVFGAQNRLNQIFRMGMEYALPLLGGMKNEHTHEFLPRANITLRLIQEICKTGSSSHTICMQFLQTIFGLQPSQYDQDKIHIMLSAFGAGTSLKTIDHILQLLKSGRFCQYDYGVIPNMMHYASVSPPDYDLRKVTAPVSIHYGARDMIVEPAAIDKLVSRLPNVVSKFLSPYSDFSHLDYIFSMNAKVLVFNDVMATIRKY